ncbi:MAG: DoxX family membrane protein [Flavobacteriales bacterium]|nr:DoxX family membrane protein [Flavobacteriales bacterium]
MESIKRLNKWTNTHNPFYVLDFFRWSLGTFLFYKGVLFLGNIESLSTILNHNINLFGWMWLVHYVLYVHVVGGILIAVGLLTRPVILFQIPILLGAIIINFTGAMDPINLLQASIAFGLCALFLILGSGKHSVDYRVKMQL